MNTIGSSDKTRQDGARAGRPGGLIPPIGPRAWRILAGQALSQIGSGMTFPILLIYLSKVRGIDLATSGLVLSMTSVAGLVALPLTGAFVDRVGAGRALVLGLTLCSLGTGGYAFVHRPAAAMVASAFYGVGISGMWNALSTLFARVVPPELRGHMFGVNYALQNLGFGIGATIGGLVLDTSQPLSFQILFWADAASFALFAAVLLLSGEVRRSTADPAGTAESVSGEETTAEQAPVKVKAAGYRDVLRDKALFACVAINTLLSAVSFSQLNSALPAWATGPLNVSPRVLGFGFLANTLTITLAQLFVMRYLLEGHRRTRAVAGAAILFGSAWLITLAAGWFPAGALAGGALVVSLIVFGLGETVLSPSLPALVSDLAPDELRGRYNAVYSLSWQIGPIIGPAVAGFMLRQGLGRAHFTILAIACVLAAALSIASESVVPSTANIAHASAEYEE